MIARLIWLFFATTFAQQAMAAEPAAIDTKQIEQITGVQGALNQQENVFKISKPRNDVKIDVDHWTMPPFMGLTSWAAFTPSQDGQTMMMGDTVVIEDEVNDAMSAALDAGLEVTALHNHFFFDAPKVFFMHIGGMGDAATLAGGVKKIYDRIAAIRAAQPQPLATFGGPKIGASNAISGDALAAIVGVKGQAKDGMFKVSIGRPATMHGIKIGNEMGVNTWAAFAGTDDEAVMDGDFAMTAKELQPVLKAMRGEKINVVAIHSHMSDEEPRFVFLHYWGKGKATALAQSLKSVLDAQSKVDH